MDYRRDPAYCRRVALKIEIMGDAARRGGLRLYWDRLSSSFEYFFVRIEGDFLGQGRKHHVVFAGGIASITMFRIGTMPLPKSAKTGTTMPNLSLTSL